MLPELHNLLLFCLAAFVLIVIPGPAVLYIIACSIDQGRMAGLVSTFGVAFGALFHIIAAAYGLSALLMSSALAFTVIKYLGAAYLIYLGIQKIFVKEKFDTPTISQKRRLRDIFFQGAIVNLLNPKTALFFLAFLPQFVNVSKGNVALQIVILGCIFVTIGVISDGLWAMLSGSLGNWVKKNTEGRGSASSGIPGLPSTFQPSVLLQTQRYLTGGIFIGLGIVTALTGSGKK